jgi:hypothetical protein
MTAVLTPGRPATPMGDTSRSLVRCHGPGLAAVGGTLSGRPGPPRLLTVGLRCRASRPAWQRGGGCTEAPRGGVVEIVRARSPCLASSQSCIGGWRSLGLPEGRGSRPPQAAPSHPTAGRMASDLQLVARWYRGPLTRRSWSGSGPRACRSVALGHGVALRPCPRGGDDARPPARRQNVRRGRPRSSGVARSRSPPRRQPMGAAPGLSPGRTGVVLGRPTLPGEVW